MNLFRRRACTLLIRRKYINMNQLPSSQEGTASAIGHDREETLTLPHIKSLGMYYVVCLPSESTEIALICQSDSGAEGATPRDNRKRAVVRDCPCGLPLRLALNVGAPSSQRTNLSDRASTMNFLSLQRWCNDSRYHTDLSPA